MFVVPENDAESVAIKDMLADSGEDFVVTKQQWGASWDGLEDDVKQKVRDASANGETVYGVELKHKPLTDNAVNIDHHVYGEDKDWQTGKVLYPAEDRHSDKASIEQVADVLGRELTPHEMMIAANDKGYIEEQAVEAIQHSYVEHDVTVVNLPHSKTATVCDRIPETEDNGLLINCGDGEVDFYGQHDMVESLQSEYSNAGSWSGATFWAFLGRLLNSNQKFRRK